MTVRLANSTRGSVLLLVLWLTIVMGVMGLSYMGSVRTQLAMARQRDGRTQAAWAARAGVEQARAILQETDLGRTDQVDLLWDDEDRFANREVGPAKFSLLGSLDPKTGVRRFGLTDEAARINLNIVDEQMLEQVEGLTDEQRQSLLDWVDTDRIPRPQGAESAYYLELKDPYSARDGALRTVRELIRVRGWAELFQTAWPDPWARLEERGDKTVMDRASALELLDTFTVWSAHEAKAPDGQDLLKLANATEEQMKRRIKDLKDNEARAIVAYRKDRKFNSPVDLLEVTEATGQQSSGGRGGNSPPNSSGSGGGANPSSQSQGSGRKVFDLKRVGQIIDYFSTQSDDSSAQSPGGINLNTAGEDVLKVLPGMTDALLGAIRQRREGGHAFEKAGEIAELAGMTDEIFKKMYPHLTARSRRMRVMSRGMDMEANATVTVEAVLAVGDEETTILYWREY